MTKGPGHLGQFLPQNRIEGVAGVTSQSLLCDRPTHGHLSDLARPWHHRSHIIRAQHNRAIGVNFVSAP
jgi:hypothetical protein